MIGSSNPNFQGFWANKKKKNFFSSLIKLKMSNNENALVISDDPHHPANLIPELCRLFYTLGWVTGTGGGISIKKE